MTPTTITKSFLSQGIFLVSLIGATIFCFNAVRNDIKGIVKEAVTDAVTPIIERQDRQEGLQKETSALLAVTSSRASVNYICLNSFLSSYNKSNHKEFLKPSEIKEEKD